MSGLSFGQPWALFAAAAVPLALGLWALRGRRGLRRSRTLSRDEFGGPRYSSALILSLAALAAIVAAAQPRWGERQSAIPRTGAELIVVLDISRSMEARDVQPSRLEAAKVAIRSTFDRLGGDRVGLVVFAGSARLRFPLTTDLAAALQVVSSLETGSVIVEGGTSASLGLDIALSTFDPAVDTGRVILLITDGDDLGADPAGVATRLQASRVDLLVVGVGTPQGATVPVFDARSRTSVDKKGKDGTPIVSKLNEPFLRALAAASGGRYLGSDLSNVPGAVAGRLSAIQRTRFEQNRATIPIERFQWFAASALAGVVLATLIERLPRRGRRAVVSGLLVATAFFLGACATRDYELNEAGLSAFRSGDSERAINLFIEAQARRPNDARVSLNLAAAYHQADRHEEAAIAVRRVLLSPDPRDRARAYASIGHHEFAAGRLPEALDAFKRALMDNPEDELSRHDYEVVLRLLQPADRQPGGEQPSGDGEPQPGAQPQGGQSGQQQPNQQGQGGTPGATGQRPTSPAEVERQINELDAEIARLVGEAGDDPTPAEALRILQLLANRARVAAVRDALSGSQDPNDY